MNFTNVELGLAFLSTAIVRRLPLHDLLTAFRMFRIQLGSIRTHFFDTRFILNGIAVAWGHITLSRFVAALFAD
jgi:hypothetical protein